MSKPVTNSTSQLIVSKEGWLSIQENIREEFHLRWFVLKGNLLFYYERDGDEEPIGIIILEGCYIDSAKHDLLFYFKINFFGTNTSSYMLGANTEESRKLWIVSLKSASYNCVKSIIANLENCLKNLEDRDIKISHPIKIIEPKQINESSSTDNSLLPSISGFNTLHRKVPHNGPSRSPSPNYKIQGYTSIITFNDMHREFGKLIIKDRNERFRLCKNKNEPLQKSNLFL